MKVAVTYENGQVFQHFGRTEQFKVYDVSDGRVNGGKVIGTNGTGHGALAGFLKAEGVHALICGGIGGGAQMALAEAGIELYAGVSGSADEAARAFAEGRLSFAAEANCDHHGHHGEGHSCGDHGHHGEGHSCGDHGHHGEGHSCGDHGCHKD
ncbi:MAG: dinitrogenase iron-molybdenum cofactor biosynthesis protein [Lachnospiraceae bacterium]|nr:dinitrogenase iron-molybdenum cofactor biosynthesis protein [Lachnospiraceae bacterium]